MKTPNEGSDDSMHEFQKQLLIIVRPVRCFFIGYFRGMPI